MCWRGSVKVYVMFWCYVLMNEVSILRVFFVVSLLCFSKLCVMVLNPIYFGHQWNVFGSSTINCEMRSLQLIKINTLFSKSKAFQSLLMQIWCSMMLLTRLSSPSLFDRLYMRSSITIQINIHTSLASNFIIFCENRKRWKQSTRNITQHGNRALNNF